MQVPFIEWENGYRNLILHHRNGIGNDNSNFLSADA